MHMKRRLCLLLAAAQTEVLRLVFLPDSNDREDGKQHGDADPNRCDRCKPAPVVVSEDVVPREDRSDELHKSHSGQ